jgi:hypothetical protein
VHELGLTSVCWYTATLGVKAADLEGDQDTGLEQWLQEQMGVPPEIRGTVPAVFVGRSLARRSSTTPAYRLRQNTVGPPARQSCGRSGLPKGAEFG